MGRYNVRVTLLAVAAAAAMPLAATPAAQPGGPEMARLRAAFVDAYRRGDVASLARFYTRDATYVGTAGDVVVGRERLLIGLRREVPFFRDFAVEPAEFDRSGRLAYERGTYRAVVTVPGREPQPVSGPYLIVYERGADRRYRIRVHMSGRSR